MRGRFCTSCGEETEDVLVCPLCGDRTIAPAVARERDRDEDGREDRA
jgi:predicted RNA-binding Zn-ribbon protein involved in translation (DUF1610 family)